LPPGVVVPAERLIGAKLKGNRGQGEGSLLSSFRNHEKFYATHGCGRLCAKIGVVVREKHLPVNLKGERCPRIKELVPYNFLPGYKEELQIVKEMLKCGIPFAMVRWTDGAGQLFKGTVNMKTVLRGKSTLSHMTIHTMQNKCFYVPTNTHNLWSFMHATSILMVLRDWKYLKMCYLQLTSIRTLIRGRSDFKGGTSGMLSGQQLVQLQLDVSHPRFFQAMPMPACLEGMFNEKVTGKVRRIINHFCTLVL
jgi:hypothetical protein